jgi:hypothetical protein
MRVLFDLGPSRFDDGAGFVSFNARNLETRRGRSQKSKRRDKRRI